MCYNKVERWMSMNKLKELRKEKGLTQQELAEVLGVTKLTIANWENGKHELKIGVAEELAEFFGVQFQYLLGLTDIKTAQEEIEIMMNEFNNDFIKFLKTHDIYLSDQQINSIIQTMYSMSNVNMQYLGKLSRERDFDGMDMLKKSFFSQLFEYSSIWSSNYNSLKRLSEGESPNSKL